MTEIGTIIDGKYEILKEIGRGGMSTVYLAMDRRLNKQWAVKEIRKRGNGKNDEIVVNSLLAEANLMKRLDHPTLPRIVDIIDNGITIYVVMDYIEGESLDKILKEFGVQEEERVIEWAKQICDALSYLHSQKPRPIVYRDMKPANIMLKPEGNIKIIDFGIAREYKEQNLADTKVLGTRGFAPPEAYNGQTTPRSDIYSLGMTMHNLLTGVDPRKGDAYLPVRQINPNLSEGIEAIIDKCVQPAEENRYQSCADLLYDLEHPEMVGSEFKKKQKRKLVGFIIPVVLCLVMLLSGTGTAIGAKVEKDNNYKAYIEHTDDIEFFEKAIALYPERPEAYSKLVKYYEDKAAEGNGFTDKDLRNFEGIYIGGKKDDDGNLSKNNSEELLKANPQEYAKINYRIAILCFTDYTSKDVDGNVNYNFTTNCRKALDYLEKNKDIPYYEGYEIAQGYYQICKFQTEYIANTRKDVSVEQYKNILADVDKTLDSVKSNEKLTNYDRLGYYGAVYYLLYYIRDDLSSAGVEEALVLDLFDKVNDLTKNIKSSGLSELSAKQKKDIIDHYDSYRKSIKEAYGDAEEG